MATPEFDAFIFDLDGTLLHTLPDLVVVANKALEMEGLPQRSEEEILSFVGNGAQVLMEKAVPEGTAEEVTQRAYQHFCDLYPELGIVLTKPFDGMMETIAKLKAKSKKLGILSNKFDAGVKDVEAAYFPDVFDLAYGESERIPRKPDPTGLRTMIADLGCVPERCCYIGDSVGDMRVAHSAGVFAAAASWGYQPTEWLLEEHPDAVLEKPIDLLTLV